jgi:hypothetical protein
MSGTPCWGFGCHTPPEEFAEPARFAGEKQELAGFVGLVCGLLKQLLPRLKRLTEDLMSYRNRALVGILCLGFGLAGCSSARDVEVSGKVTAPSTLTVGDKVVIDFIDVVGAGADAKQSVAHTTQLAALGDFKETVPLEGDQVLIRAIDDRDGNGACSAGEAWAETHAEINDGKAVATSLMLSTTACPAAIAAD